MSTNSNIIKPAVPPKPKLPPKPKHQGDRWRRATDVILRPEAGEEAAQDRKRQQDKHKSCHQPAPRLVHANPTLKTPSSQVRDRPIPKPRQRWTATPQNNQPLFDGGVHGERSDYGHQQKSTHNTSEFYTTQSTCQSSCPCVCHHTHESNSKRNADKLASPSADNINHLDYWHIVRPETPQRVPPTIPLPSLPRLEMPESSLSPTGKLEVPDTLEAVYMEVSSDSEEQNTPISTPTESSIQNAAISTKSQSGNIKPSPCPRNKFLKSMMNMNCKITDSIHPDQDVEPMCDVFLDELPKNVDQNCKVKQETDTQKSKGKRHSVQLLKKLSSLELKLSLFQNKPQEKQVANQNGSTTCGSQTSLNRHSVVESSPQTASNPVKKASAQEMPSSASEAKECKVEASQVSTRGRCMSLEEGLWQDRSIVKKKGILRQLSEKQLLLQESLYEVVTSERTYLKSLDVVVEHFLESPELNILLSPRDRKCLFSGISKIRRMSQSFLKDMKEELNNNPFCDTCEVIQRYATGPFGAYVDYIRNLPYQEQTLRNFEQKSPQISEILRRLQEDPCCNRLPLKSYLVLPFQRITRLKILVEAILKKTEPGSQGQASAERALKDVSKVVEACNYEVGRMRQTEEMVHIANKIEFECKSLPLVSSSRWLLKEGDMAQLSTKENIFGQRKLLPIYLFLFNDLLLVATRKGPDRFVVRDHVHRSLIEVNSVEEDADVEGCDENTTFKLALLKNHKGSISHLWLQAPSQAEKASWMEMLTHRTDGEDEIYEEWDCPQVQCTVAYHAQQQGELSLQPGDIINVTHKTSKGFLEGWRADGERGWFPAVCVEEIANEHVQRRHFRQRYRVLQAANRVMCRRLRNDKRETACFR